jgi:hypothetical protein
MLTVGNVFFAAPPIHLVVSYDFNEQNVFVDGDLKARSPTPGGYFKNWDTDYRLVMGNEATGNRPWSGKTAYMAISNHALEHLPPINRSNWLFPLGMNGSKRLYPLCPLDNVFYLAIGFSSPL